MKRDEIVISVTLAYVAVLAICAAGLLGYSIAADEHSSKDAMMEEFKSWTLPEQQDFALSPGREFTQRLAIAAYLALPREDKRDVLLYLNINKDIPNESAKAIAEDWCAINRQTQRVCWNARMSQPIRGVK